MFDVDNCIETIKQGRLLDEKILKALCLKVTEILAKESNVVHINAPVTVVGDVHGSEILFSIILDSFMMF
jgi:serine/threonine-protein phosphatase PPG1